MDYQFHKRWSIGIQTDTEIQSFEVEDGNALLERAYPFAVAGIFYYHMKDIGLFM